MKKHKVFISYHRADTKQELMLEEILRENHIPFYSVPKDADFNGWKHEHIAQFICAKMQDCDVFICLVGKDTYSRSHVDWEIHKALKGGFAKRKGIIAVLIENRKDSIYEIDYSIFPTRLQDNEEYIVLDQLGSFRKKVLEDIEYAYINKCDESIQINNTSRLMKLRHRLYYDN